MDPVLGRVVVEGEQLVQVVGDLGDGFGELGAVGQFERGDGASGVVAVICVPDLGQGALGRRVSRLRQRRQNVGNLVDVMPNSA